MRASSERAYCSVKEGLDDGALEVRVRKLDRKQTSAMLEPL